MDEQAPVLATAEYLSEVSRCREEITAAPWGLARRRISFEQLLKRLAADRDSLLACLGEGTRLPRVHLLIADDDAHPQASRTRQSWSLQSHPLSLQAVTTSAVRAEDSPWQSLVQLFDLPVHEDDLILLARAGDLFHPALAGALSLRDLTAPHKPLAWTWNSVCGQGSDAIALRRPGRAPLSLLSANYVGRAVAFRAGFVAAAPAESVNALLGGDPSLLLLALAAQTPLDWAHHPERLSAATSQSDATPGWSNPDSSGADRFARPRLAGLRSLASSLGGAQWQLNQSDDTARPLVEPVADGSGVSVVIPFRDHVEETLKAVQAVSGQQGVSAIEVILVNNQSEPGLLGRLKAGLQSFTETLQIRFIDYPAGFSHSRQCNLGVEQAIHDTVVILNNDAYLQEPDVFEQMVRWAGVAGVATVGVRIVDQQSNLVCGGLRARLKTGLDFQAMVEESRDPVMSDRLREVMGNTGACFAIRRDRFLALGGFDGVNFPIGMNDVDFCLRAIRSGLTHINLGWLTVCHKPGTSRGVSDELYQRLLLRERYPEVTRLSQFQLGLDDEHADDPWSGSLVRRLLSGTLRRLRIGSGK